MGRVPGLTEGADVAADVRESCDAVVVGSGAGGATMAAELTAAGMDVIVVEEGGYHPTGSFTADAGRALRTLYRDGGAQSSVGRPPIAFSEGRCVGGSTVINGGMSFRTPPHVLERWAREEDVLAVGPEDMAPWFDRVEQRLSVGPQDPGSIGRDNELLKLGAERRGWKVIDNRRNQVHCCGCNNCVLGCPTGAKRSMLVTNVPRALRGGARLFADCRVERVTRRGKRATGIVGRFARHDGRAGPRLEVEAGVVVSACGSIQTQALLRRSGFRSPSRQLGRHLTMHPNGIVVGVFDESVRGWHGVHQGFQVREFADDGIIIAASNLPPSLVALALPHHGSALGEVMADYDRMVTAGCLIEDSTSGRVLDVPGVGPVPLYRASEGDLRRVVRGVALTAEALFEAGARKVLLPFHGVPDLLGPDDVRALFRRTIPRGAMQLLTVHLMGTARMSEDRARGVVSSYGAFHDAAGLFVADASLFPGPVGLNPMETIVALASRNADWLVAHRQHHGI
ncbi:GMC family oxidoreductase [soil metagenome]